MVCAKCDQVIANVKESIKCVECNLEYHASCCRVRTVAKLNKMSAKSIAAWKCEECSPDSGSVKSDNDDTQIMELLKHIQKEIAENNKTHKESFSKLEKTMTSVNSTLGDIKAKMTAVEEENKKLRNECASLTEKNELLEKQVSKLQVEMADMQQYSRNKNIELRGIPVTTGENIFAVLENVAIKIGVNFDINQISAAHRLGAPRHARWPPSIVCQFISQTARSEWLAATRKKRIQTTDLSPTLKPAAPVFINEHLTVHNKTVLAHAKAAVKDGKLKYAWCKDGKILVRKTENSPAHRVRTTIDVNDIARPVPDNDNHGTDQ